YVRTINEYKYTSTNFATVKKNDELAKQVAGLGIPPVPTQTGLLLDQIGGSGLMALISSAWKADKFMQQFQTNKSVLQQISSGLAAGKEYEDTTAQ
ncbi:MAG TPA: hypothetical protein VG603_05675, partial [Chitinophagales bacterium]|nr:hypothetical protein [Chitinophagales bacterium]